MLPVVRKMVQLLSSSARDLAPIVAVVAFFQIVVVGEAPEELGALVTGLVAVLLGLTLFVRGLEMSLFPLGENMATAFARKGSLSWLLLFAFALGFGTTVAEPALIAVAAEAAEVASGQISGKWSKMNIQNYPMKHAY